MKDQAAQLQKRTEERTMGGENEAGITERTSTAYIQEGCEDGCH